MPRAVYGVNDLYTWCINNAELGQKILSEWTGIDADGKSVDIKKIANQSNKKMVWKCKKGHTWVTTIQKRTLLKSGCPYCTNQKIAVGENDLYTWAKQNRPELIDEFYGEDADGNKVTMQEFTRSSKRKVKWAHIVDGDTHMWEARISDRTYNNSRCPICHSKNTVIQGKNDLYTWCKENKDYGDILKDQWIGLDIDGNFIDMHSIAKGSHTKVAWVCDCCEVWYASPLSRLYHKNTECPKCSKRNAQIIKRSTLLDSSMSLGDWCDSNGIYGELLRMQFCGIDEHGDNVDIYKITYGSQVKVWWKHTTKYGEEHRWLAQIKNRVFRQSNCPYCNHRSTSLNEQILYNCFKQIYSKTINRGILSGYEFDIIVPELRLCIEYGSKYYHTGREEHDEKKKEFCKNNSIKFIRVESVPRGEDTYWSPDYIQDILDSDRGLVKNLLNYICDILDIDVLEIDYEAALQEAVNYMRGLN